MNKDTCFIIEEKVLYVEKILIELDYVPLFYVCSDSNNSKYLVLFSDGESDKYLIVKSNYKIIRDMLKGNISMQSAILSQDFYWEVFAVGCVEEDIVCKKSMKQVIEEDLPREGGMFEITTEEMAQYIIFVEKEMYTEGNYTAFGSKDSYIDEEVIGEADVQMTGIDVVYETYDQLFVESVKVMKSLKVNYTFDVTKLLANETSNPLKSQSLRYDSIKKITIGFQPDIFEAA